jgi:hypothetical protein
MPLLNQLEQIELSRGHRIIDDTLVSSDLPEEYGFALRGRKLSPRTAQNFRAICGQIVAMGEPRNGGLLVKNPWDVCGAPPIQRLYPRARFLFLVRRSLETVNSQIRAVRTLLRVESRYHSLLDVQYRWFIKTTMPRVVIRTIAESRCFIDMMFLRHIFLLSRLARSLEALRPGSWLLLRYEDLLNQPSAELRRALDFLEISVGNLGGEPAATIASQDRGILPDVLKRWNTIKSRLAPNDMLFGYDNY